MLSNLKSKCTSLSLLTFALLFYLPSIFACTSKPNSCPSTCIYKGDTRLHKAAKTGDLLTIKKLLSKGLKIDSADKKERTPLYWAAYHGNNEIIKFLLSKGANIEGCRRYGPKPLITAASRHTDTAKLLVKKGASINPSSIDASSNELIPLYGALRFGDLELVKMLLPKGLDYQKRIKHGSRLFFNAVEGGDIEIVKYLYSKGVWTNPLTSERDMQSRLNIAALNGHVNITKYLIEKGLDVNKESQATYLLTRSGKTRTPLEEAIAGNHIEVVKILLEKGADIELKRKARLYTPLLRAIIEGKSEIAKLLLDKGAKTDFSYKHLTQGKTLLHVALETGKFSIASKLIEKGVNIEKAEATGEKILLLMSIKGDVDAVKFLLAHGAKVNAKSSYKKITALSGAVSKGHSGIVKILLDNKADVFTLDVMARNLLHIAVENGSLDLVKLFVSLKVPVNTRYQGFQTPIDIATKKKRPDLVNALSAPGAKIDINAAFQNAVMEGMKKKALTWIEKGAKINSKGPLAENALHLAAANGNHTMVKLLLDKGANIHSKDSYGQTPIHYAATAGRVKAMIFLLERGAKINALTNSNETVLHLAVKRKQHKIVKLLIAKNIKLSVKDKLGQTALHIAALNGDMASAKLLLNKGIDASTKNKAGKAALDLAKKKGHKDMVRLLLSVKKK